MANTSSWANVSTTFLDAYDEDVPLMFDAYIDPGEPQVREAVALRLAFLEFVRAVQNDPGEILTHYDAFLQAQRRRIVAHAERHLGDLEREYTVIPGNKTTAFTMMSKIKFSIEAQAKLRTVLGFGNFVVNDLRINPIAEMVTVHYARFGLWDLDKLLFASIYDGDWVQYKAQRKYLEDNTVPTNVFYSAYMDITSKDILACVALGKALWDFTQVLPTDAQSFYSRYIAFLSANQGLLP